MVFLLKRGRFLTKIVANIRINPDINSPGYFEILSKGNRELSDYKLRLK